MHNFLIPLIPKNSDKLWTLAFPLAALCLMMTVAAAESDVQTQPAAGNAPSSSVLLQGGVKKEVLDALAQLKEVGTAEEKIKKASEDLYQESMRPQMTMEEEPELIGVSVIELPMPVMSGALLPPRKKWVDR